MQDDGYPAGSMLATTWTVLSGPGSVTFGTASAPVTTVSFGYPGTYVLRLTASDGELSSTSDVTVVVGAPAGAVPMVALTAPVDGARLSSPTDVGGTVSGGEWKLEYRPGGEDADRAWVIMSSGSGQAPSGTLGRLDTSMMLNGIYAIRLTGTTAEGAAEATIHVSVEKNLKVGNFTVSFSDLSVPVAGLPIEVIRTYDSRDKTVGDFGVGWNVSLRNLRVETSGTLGKGWHQQAQPGFWPVYCVTQSQKRFVTVTFPTGKVYRFKSVLAPDCEMFTQVAMTGMAFEAEPGTHGTLTTTSGDALVVADGALLDADLRPFNPTTFEFTGQDGTVYSVEKNKGLRWMQDRNGNTVNVSSAGVIHSSGKSISFERNSSGRIVKITDPMDRELTYEYDPAGNLAAVVDREGQRTTFAYNDAHGLVDIFDPLGKRAIRNEYDDDGRLVRNIDADGKIIEYTHDLAANQEIITDRTGAQRVLTYDTSGNVTSETDAEGGTITRSFDSDDNRLSETDALGNRSSWTYDSVGNVTVARDALEKWTTYTYNAWGQVLTTTDPLGRATTNTYDGNGNLLSTKDAAGHATTFTYNRGGQQTSRTTRTGYTTTYAHDGFGNLVGELDPLGNATTYTYDGSGNRLTETRTRTKADGTQETLVTRFTYDKNGRLLSTTQPDGSVTRTTYNDAGLRETTVDALDRVTHYAYDDQGRLTSTLYPDGTSTSATYDEEGRRLTSTDRGGRVTTMVYDGVGRLKKTIYHDQTFTSTEYYANGWVKSSTDARGHTTRYEYDAAGRQTVVWDANNKPTRFTYDDAGNQVTVTDALNHTTTSFYDANNRLWKTQFHDSSFRTTTYDDEGQRIAETDQANKPTGFGYDQLGRLETVTDALQQVTRYAYDEVGNRTSVTDAATKVTRFEYDQVGREIRRILPDGKFELKTYKKDGALWTRTDFQLRTTVYDYDPAGRLTSKTYPDESTVGFTYYPSGRRQTAVDARGTTRYTYDNRDRLTVLEYPDGKRLEYTYNADGNRESLKAKVGETVLTTGYTYNLLDRMDTVTDPDSRVFGLEYDDVGSLTKLVRPNGVDTRFEHNQLNQLKNIRTYTRATDTTIASYGYSLGPTGIRRRVDEADGTARVYEYDDLYRLTKETVTGGQDYENSFTYDAVSNRKTMTTTRGGEGGSVDAAAGEVDAGMSGARTINYGYDNRDRLTSEDGTVYSWSENGNLVGRSGEATYEWDFEDRLVKVTKADGTVVENTYDVDGVLVRTTVNGVGTDLLVDTSGGLSHVVAEVDGSGAVTALYVRAGDMLLEEVRGSVAKMYEADALGSTRSLLDTAGAQTDTWSYEAFGTTISSTGTSASPYRFAGERWIADVGMYQNRARWLDTRTGRFVSVDPERGRAGLPSTLHPFIYGEANPVVLVDPTGREFTLPNLMTTVGVIGITAAVPLLAGCTTRPVTTVVGGLLTPTGARNRFEFSLAVRTSLQKAFSYDGTRFDLSRSRIYIDPAQTSASFTIGDEIFLNKVHGEPQTDPDSTKFVVLHELTHSVQMDRLGIGEMKLRRGRERRTYGEENAYDIWRFPGLGSTALEVLDVVNPDWALEAIAQRVATLIFRDRASYGL